MLGPVRAFVGERGVIAFGVSKGVQKRHVDGIGMLHVAGTAAAMHDPDRCFAEESLGVRDSLQSFARSARAPVITFGKAVDLFDIEDGVALKEVDFGGFFLTFFHAPHAGITRSPVFIDDLCGECINVGGADLAAQQSRVKRLKVGHCVDGRAFDDDAPDFELDA
ncbi:MAG: hypothetical protein QOI05_1067 [Bradyrhizobium sp.]|nr:hypothetical protein [Bradyrhizobium sp.]